MNPNAQAYLNNHLSRIAGMPDDQAEHTGKVFGDGNVINAVRVFEGLRGLKGIENLLWFLRFELAFNQECGNRESQSFLKSDIARGEILQAILDKRRKAVTSPTGGQAS